MPNVAVHLERMLAAPMVEALRAAGQLASDPTAHAHEVYLAGGPVRDILLGQRPKDLDLSVVGDGEEFARVLAAKMGGQLVQTSEFGTACVLLSSGPVDIATARFETYSEPGALPHVTPAGIREDLARRDFSVNAMAVAVWPAKWGELIDPYGGASDTLRRRLRVLHDRSFQDDPTRIIRGLRYEARLGFKFDPRTLDLLGRDKHYLESVSAARVRAELQKALAEPTRAQALRTADSQSVLTAIHPSLRVSSKALEVMEKQTKEGDRLLYDLALLTSTLTDTEAAALVTRLDPPKEWREIILAGPRYRAFATLLERKDLSASEVVSLLGPFPVPVLEAQRDVAPPALQRERLDSYLTRLQHVRPECTGDDLLRAGVPQGPVVGRLLAELRTARLDGRVSTREEELALVKRRLPMLLRPQG